MRPENKINLGVIQVHKNVIADICSTAVAGIEGVTLARNEYFEKISKFIGVRKNSAVDVKVDFNNQVSVVVKVVIRYGLNLSDVSRQVQDAVMTAADQMADVDLKDVDVSIQGIERG